MKYLIKRFKMALIVLAAVSVIIFIMIHLQPGNPYANMIDPSVPPEMVEKRLESIGYYDPVPIQYIKWVGRLLRGDMGYSIVYKAPVASLITKALKNTIVLSAASLIVSTLISILLGLLSAEKPNSIIDNIINASEMIIYANKGDDMIAFIDGGNGFYPMMFFKGFEE